MLCNRVARRDVAAVSTAQIKCEWRKRRERKRGESTDYLKFCSQSKRLLTAVTAPCGCIDGGVFLSWSYPVSFWAFGTVCWHWKVSVQLFNKAVVAKDCPINDQTEMNAKNSFFFSHSEILLPSAYVNFSAADQRLRVHAINVKMRIHNVN